MGTHDKTANWKAVKASVVGDDHLQAGKQNEDYAAFRLVDDSIFVGVLADGAGSALMGSAGAKIAVETILSYLSDISTQTLPGLFTHEAIPIALSAARDAATADAEANNLALRDYHATIVGVIASAKYGFIFHIGDGGAATISADGSHTISSPANSEFADQTYFYTEDSWQSNLRITRIDDPKTIILATDGCTQFLFGSRNAELAFGFVDALSKSLRTETVESGTALLTNVLNSEKVRRINGDDKTLLWAELIF